MLEVLCDNTLILIMMPLFLTGEKVSEKEIGRERERERESNKEILQYNRVKIFLVEINS